MPNPYTSVPCLEREHRFDYLSQRQGLLLRLLFSKFQCIGNSFIFIIIIVLFVYCAQVKIIKTLIGPTNAKVHFSTWTTLQYFSRYYGLRIFLQKHVFVNKIVICFILEYTMENVLYVGIAYLHFRIEHNSYKIWFVICEHKLNQDLTSKWIIVHNF